MPQKKNAERPLRSKTTKELADIAARLRKLAEEIDYRVSELKEEMLTRQESADVYRRDRKKR